MKRLISLALVCLLLLSMHLAAWADGSITVEYDGCIAGEEYALFILRDETAGYTPDNILFMDQHKAETGEGRVLFIAPDFTGEAAFLSGRFRDGGLSPRKLGINEKPINLPAMLTRIEDAAFEGDTFTHVYLGESVTSIGSRAFADCGELVYIYIPDSVTDIADDAFENSPNLVIACRSKEISYYAAKHGISCKILD